MRRRIALALSRRNGEEETVVMAHVRRTWLNGKHASAGAALAPNDANGGDDADASALSAADAALSGPLVCILLPLDAYRLEHVRSGRAVKHESMLVSRWTRREGGIVFVKRGVTLMEMLYLNAAKRQRKARPYIRKPLRPRTSRCLLPNMRPDPQRALCLLISAAICGSEMRQQLAPLDPLLVSGGE